MNDQSVVAFKNLLFVYHEGRVYGYANGSFERINDTFRFISNPAYAAVYAEPISMSMCGDFLLVRHYDTFFVYSATVGAWGRWIFTSSAPVGNFVKRPVFEGNDAQHYNISSCDLSDERLWEMDFDWNTTASESMVCSATTKVFDFGVPYAFKRLFWWGVDAVTNDAVGGLASPIIVNFVPTWGDVATNPWSFYLTKTWGSLVTVPPDVVSPPVDANSGATFRRIYKFLKGLRFRQISFTVTMVTDATSSNGPVRLNGIIPMVTAHEGVVQTVS
jgi:hypothetical protein